MSTTHNVHNIAHQCKHFYLASFETNNSTGENPLTINGGYASRITAAFKKTSAGSVDGRSTDAEEAQGRRELDAVIQELEGKVVDNLQAIDEQVLG
jgi:hypothetical protein